MRKYRKGKRIESLDELAQQTLIIADYGTFQKVYHIGWFSSWPLRNIINGINKRQFYTAVSKET